MGSTETAIIEHITSAIAAELNRAKQIHGTHFNSHHEAFAVLMEEADEVKDEIDKLNSNMSTLWQMVKRDADPELHIYRTKQDVYRIILEAIQVAAVLEKYRSTNELLSTAVKEVEKQL